MSSHLFNALHVSNNVLNTTLSISPFLLPFLQTQRRAASVLSNLSDNSGAYNKKIRRGRGPSSGKGKTSGRGYGGQKQKGSIPRGFNGGQTKLEVVHGVRGFVNVFSVDMQPVNLDRIQSWVNQGRLDPTKPITLKELGQSRCVTNIKDGVKLLARGSEELKTPLNLVVSRASAAAIAAIEGAGGTVTTRYYTPFAIQRIFRGKSDTIHSLRSQPVKEEQSIVGNKPSFQNRLPDPASRKAIEYYRDPAHRGYLNHSVPEGQGPSLFYRAPGTGKPEGRKQRAAGRPAAGENRIW